MSSTGMNVDAPAKLNLDTFITTALSSTPAELHPFFEDFRNLYTRKLWHQLTLKLFAFVNEPASKPYRVDVFQTFVRDFEGKLNHLRLVELGVKVSREIDNPQTHLLFLTSLLSRLSPPPPPSSDATAGEGPAPAPIPGALKPCAETPEATVLLLATLAHAKLLYGDLEGTRADMDAAGKILGTLEGVDNGVNAAFYSVSGDYYKAKADYGPYYRNSLLYLACVDITTDMTPAERLARAHDLSVAALLGESIYNFGELLMHPILDSLDGEEGRKEHAWLKKLLVTFNEGNIGRYEALTPLFPQEPILHENDAFLRQKICLMALIESVFRRPAGQRTLSFETIAQETRLPVGEVEHLVMKGLSLKLIRGTIDQVSEKATIVWVQPRVLSREQIGGLAKRLDEWVGRLNGVERRIEGQALGGVGGVGAGVGVAA